MKTQLFTLSFLAFTLFMASCKKEKTTPNCSLTEDLGEFQPLSFEVPYSVFSLHGMHNENGDSATASFNSQYFLKFHGLDTIKTVYQWSNCELLRQGTKYNWRLKTRNTYMAFVIPGINSSHSSDLLIKDAVYLDADLPKAGPVGDFLSFLFTDDNSGTFTSAPFMQLLKHDYQPPSGKAAEFGYEILPSVELLDETFENVITNINDPGTSIRKIYYHRQQGLLGVVDKNDVLWKMD